jgi:archaeosine synthase beta-subunit
MDTGPDGSVDARLRSLRPRVEHLLRFARAGFEKRPDPPPRWRRVEDSRGERLILGLRTRGCSYARSHFGGCSTCGHVASTLWGYELSDSEQLASLHETLRDLGHYQAKTLCLFTSGSFLDESEISRSARRRILTIVQRRLKPRRLIIESLPTFVSKDKLSELRDAFEDVTVSIGMDAGTEVTRRICAVKDFTNAQYESAIDLCRSSAVKAAVYVGLGLPFLTPDEALFDAIEGVHLATRYGANEISIEPVALQEATLQKLLFVTRQYTPTNVWLIAAMLNGWLQRYPDDLNTVGICIGGMIYTPVPFGVFAACQGCIDHAARSANNYTIATLIRSLPITAGPNDNCCIQNHLFIPASVTLQELEARVSLALDAISTAPYGMHPNGFTKTSKTSA